MTTSSLVFIDARVSGYENLINDLPSDAEVVVLDSQTDGLEQIAAYLSGRTGVAAIHVVSHGSQGALYLGNTRVDGDYLNNHSERLASIGSRLSETGDILLYGCNVAQGDIGLQFIQVLANLSGADIAASDNLTGVNGDEYLEQITGNIESNKLDLAGLATNLAGGIVVTDIDSGMDISESLVLQSDGKILAAGWGYNGFDYDFALVRYNVDGTLDTTFSNDGKLTTDWDGGNDYGMNVALQADGKILVAGYTTNGTGSHFALSRYHENGTLDITFSGDGKLTQSFLIGGKSYAEGYDVTVQSDGKILLVGTGHYNDFSLLRYHPDGTLDTSFSNDGVLTTGFGDTTIDVAYSVAVQSDGKILVAGHSDQNGGGYLTLVRYTIDGTLDTTFSENGIFQFGGAGTSGRSILVQPDGKILLVGGYQNTPMLMRLNSDGSLDNSFPNDGRLLINDLSHSYLDDYSLSLQEDGKILVAGSSNSVDNKNKDFALHRYNVDGSLDTSFSEDGKINANFSDKNKDGRGVVIQNDGAIIITGGIYNGNKLDTISFFKSRVGISGQSYQIYA